MKTRRSIVNIILTLSLVFSTVGVTIVGMACAGTKTEQSVQCPSCVGKHQKLTTPAKKKSCCERYQKHLALRADFMRPAPQAAHHFIVAILPFFFAEQYVLRTVSSTPVLTTSPPGACYTSSDICARNATFRI